jgi:hypothetical protein
LYKYSDGKENAESVGRFGTGFLTTDCPSKVVTIESDIWTDRSMSQKAGFRVMMYRDGETAGIIGWTSSDGERTRIFR